MNKKIISLLVILVLIAVVGTIQQNYRYDLSSVGEFQFNEDIDEFVFYSPHQDDETLFFVQAIECAIAQVGSEHVKVVLVSDGAASSTQNLPEIAEPIDSIMGKANVKLSQNNQQELSDEEIVQAKQLLFSKARTNEFLEALDALGVKHYEIYTLPDGSLESHEGEIKEIIRTNLGTEGCVAHLTYSYYFDPHSDHCTVGRALQSISKENCFDENNIAYYMVKMESETLEKYYVENYYNKQKYFGLLKQQAGIDSIAKATAEYGKRCENMEAVTEDIAQAIYDTMQRDQCTVVQAIGKTQEVSELQLGVGHISVPGYFDSVAEHIENRSFATLIHTMY